MGQLAEITTSIGLGWILQALNNDFRYLLRADAVVVLVVMSGTLCCTGGFRVDCKDWSLTSAQAALWGLSPFADLGLGAYLNYDWTRWHISLK